MFRNTQVYKCFEKLVLQRTKKPLLEDAGLYSARHCLFFKPSNT